MSIYLKVFFHSLFIFLLYFIRSLPIFTFYMVWFRGHEIVGLSVKLRLIEIRQIVKCWSCHANQGNFYS